MKKAYRYIKHYIRSYLLVDLLRGLLLTGKYFFKKKRNEKCICWYEMDNKSVALRGWLMKALRRNSL